MTNIAEKLTDGLNEQQKRAVMNPCDSCTKIVAGAGTGKTKIISKRFTKLAIELNAPERILVITFTDKASGEMRERILSELKENFLEDVCGDLWISTFHSFCIRMLKKHSIEAGLSPSFKLADEKMLNRVYEYITKSIKYGQTDSIKDIDIVLGSLGLDKNILGIESFGSLNKIADSQRIFDEIFLIIKKIKSLGLTPDEFFQKTVNATTNFTGTLKRTPFKFDSKEEYTLEWSRLFKDYTDDYCVFDSAVFDLIAKEKIILDKYGKRKASEYGLAEGFPENLDVIEENELRLTRIIAAIYAIYQNLLMSFDYVDFDDLINKTIEILKNNELIRKHYQDYFKHIVIDEFQDTNGAQLELIELLLNPENANITYVGDRKQSIYGFRYAQMENLEVLHRHLERKYSKKYEPINLCFNYRSTDEVLEMVNYVTEHELSLEDEKIYAGIKHEHLHQNVFVTCLNGFNDAYTHKIKEAEYIADEILNLKIRDEAKLKDFAILVKSHAQADLIEKSLRKKGIPAIKKVNTGFFGEPVIKNTLALLRLAKYSADEIALVRILKTRFSEAQIYKLKCLMDETIFPDGDFEELKKLNFVQKYFLVKEKLPESEICEFLSKVYSLLPEIKKSSCSILEGYYRLIKEIPPYICDDDFELFKAQNDLKIFEKIISDYADSEEFISYATFLDYIDRIKQDRNFELPSVASKEPDAVQILTIHASKGLEFPYVFCAGITSSSKTADKSLFSFDMQYGDKPGFGLILNKFNQKSTPKAVLYKALWKKPREWNESLRLFYVAISRAKKYLNVLNFEPFGNNGSIKPAEYIQNLSDFLDSKKPIF